MLFVFKLLHTHTHPRNISRKTLWRKQSRFNCNGSKSVQQPIRTPANDQRRWKELCFISLFRVAGVSIFCENWVYYKGRFRDFEFFYKYLNNGVGIFAIHSTGLKTSWEISPAISAPVCTYHTHILPYFFPAKFSDTSFLRIIFGLNQIILGQLPSQPLGVFWERVLPQLFNWLILRRTRIPWK